MSTERVVMALSAPRLTKARAETLLRSLHALADAEFWQRPRCALAVFVSAASERHSLLSAPAGEVLWWPTAFTCGSC